MGIERLIHASTPLHTELLTLQEGLRLAIERHLYPSYIEIDSTDMIHSLNQGNNLFTLLLMLAGGNAPSEGG